MRRARADRLAIVAAAEDAEAEVDLADPNPDVEELFRYYDALYFQSALAAGGFVVKWGFSTQSSSFGSCSFSKPSNTITLFEAVLKYRSSTDLKNALLHEMIHAIIYVKHHRKDCSNHGPVFRAWMDAINSCSIEDPQRPVSGYNITTRHDFKPEMAFSFKGILWKCESCGDTLSRASNQGPPSDACCIENADHDETCGNMLCYWHNHKSECGGSYESMGFQSVTPVQKVTKGTRLLLSYPSETSKSKGAIQESNSAQLQENTKITKPSAEDEHLSQSSLMKATKRRRSEVVQKAVVLAVEPPKKLKTKQTLIKMEKHGLFSPVGWNDSRSLEIGTSKKTGKQQDVQIPNVPTEAPKKVKTKQTLIKMEKHGLFSPVGCNDSRSLEIGTSKKTGKQQGVQIPNVPTEGHKLFSREGCSDKKSLESSSLQKTGKRRRSKVVEKADILPDEHKSTIAQKQQRKCRGQPAKEREYAVMSAWMNIYESDRSSGSTEPLVNKRTVRRKREREIIQTYSRSKKKAKLAPFDNSRIDVSVSSHDSRTSSRKDESAQQPRSSSLCCNTAVSIKAEPGLSQITGVHSQTSAPCLDIVALQTDAPSDLIPPDSAIIVISDED